MKQISKKEWIAIAAGITVVIVFFFGNSLFSFFSGSMTSVANQDFNQTVTQTNMTQNETPAGLQVRDVVVGTGKEATVGSAVSVDYIGSFANGIKFDSSFDAGRPLQFQVGAGQLIPGFDRGVVGMKVGGKRVLTIPPELGYGPSGYPPVIPPNSTLIFEITLVSVN